MTSPVDLTTVAAVQAYLNVPNTVDATLLQTLVTAASQALATYCNRVFQVGTYTESRDGSGKQKMMLLHGPVISVSSVQIDQVIVPPTTAASGTSGFFSDSRMVYLRGYAFERGLRNVQITYQGGYSVIPADLAQACVEMVALKYKQKDRVGISGSESINGQTVSFKDIAQNAATKATADQYRRLFSVPFSGA